LVRVLVNFFEIKLFLGISKWPHISGFYTLGAKTLIQCGKEPDAVEFCRLLLEYAMNQDPFEEIEEECDGMSIYTSITALTQVFLSFLICGLYNF